MEIVQLVVALVIAAVVIVLAAVLLGGGAGRRRPAARVLVVLRLHGGAAVPSDTIEGPGISESARLGDKAWGSGESRSRPGGGGVGVKVAARERERERERGAGWARGRSPEKERGDSTSSSLDGVVERQSGGNSGTPTGGQSTFSSRRPNGRAQWPEPPDGQPIAACLRGIPPAVCTCLLTGHMALRASSDPGFFCCT